MASYLCCKSCPGVLRQTDTSSGHRHACITADD
jgi:hypothetical protein